MSFSIFVLCRISLAPEEGGGSVELVPGGRDVAVNESNMYDYVRLYANYRLVVTQEKALEALRCGVFDVLPSGALDALTAEDLRLLLNGVGDIHVGTLISYTTFNDESSESSDKLLKFKRWLWSIVEKMSNLERQDLVKNSCLESFANNMLIVGNCVPPCRCIFGRDRRHCRHPKTVSSRCHRLPYGPQTMRICPPPIPAFLGCTFRCIPARPCCATNCCWQSKPRTLDSCKNK